MTYQTQIDELRRRIDIIDAEIFDKIIEHTQAIKCLKKTHPDKGQVYFETSKIERLAWQENLDVNAVLRIFKEIMLLTDQRVVEPR